MFDLEAANNYLIERDPRVKHLIEMPIEEATPSLSKKSKIQTAGSMPSPSSLSPKAQIDAMGAILGKSVEELIDMKNRGEITPSMIRSLPLEEQARLAEAIKEVESGSAFTKLGFKDANDMLTFIESEGYNPERLMKVAQQRGLSETEMQQLNNAMKGTEVPVGEYGRSYSADNPVKRGVYEDYVGANEGSTPVEWDGGVPTQKVPRVEVDRTMTPDMVAQHGAEMSKKAAEAEAEWYRSGKAMEAAKRARKAARGIASWGPLALALGTLGYSSVANANPSEAFEKEYMYDDY